MGHLQNTGFDMEHKLDLLGEMPCVIDGRFIVDWSFEYSWFLTQWAFFSSNEAQNICDCLFESGYEQLFALSKQNYESPDQGLITISTKCVNEFIFAMEKIWPDECLLANKDCSIVFYCDNRADLLAIRCSRKVDMVNIFSKLMKLHS